MISKRRPSNSPPVFTFYVLAGLVLAVLILAFGISQTQTSSSMSAQAVLTNADHKLAARNETVRRRLGGAAFGPFGGLLAFSYLGSATWLTIDGFVEGGLINDINTAGIYGSTGVAMFVLIAAGLLLKFSAMPSTIRGLLSFAMCGSAAIWIVTEAKGSVEITVPMYFAVGISIVLIGLLITGFRGWTKVCVLGLMTSIAWTAAMHSFPNISYLGLNAEQLAHISGAMILFFLFALAGMAATARFWESTPLIGLTIVGGGAAIAGGIMWIGIAVDAEGLPTTGMPIYYTAGVSVCFVLLLLTHYAWQHEIVKQHEHKGLITGLCWSALLFTIGSVGAAQAVMEGATESTTEEALGHMGQWVTGAWVGSTFYCVLVSWFVFYLVEPEHNVFIILNSMGRKTQIAWLVSGASICLSTYLAVGLTDTAEGVASTALGLSVYAAVAILLIHIFAHRFPSVAGVAEPILPIKNDLVRYGVLIGPVVWFGLLMMGGAVQIPDGLNSRGEQMYSSVPWEIFGFGSIAFVVMMFSLYGYWLTTLDGNHDWQRNVQDGLMILCAALPTLGTCSLIAGGLFNIKSIMKPDHIILIASAAAIFLTISICWTLARKGVLSKTCG